ncbi:epimerase [Pseudidiomarina salinarum]|uniref:Epimerase n=1 Tax=Pseudidiomarina salinarum TaxID=435908 RepID=A0A094IWZ6_9GAMM|nr:TIGR01777 family oxidoreductase [Pseudidiomarina salinarum]KFZ31652.1 epimerase [Pseudidiomarina salinarum]RUO70577.1 TIGR01777 family protein [Pseudidiomarina salinarum]
MKLLLTGGTGLIGSALIEALWERYQITITTRNPKKAIRRFGKKVHAVRGLEEIQDISEFYAVINLQGEDIFAKRWTTKQKQEIEQSRWTITRQLTERIKESSQPPQVFISGSAVGYYGPQGDEPVTEHTVVEADDFAHHLCAEWERLALAAQSERTRVCVIRTGIVVAEEDSALQQMLPPYLLGLGGPLGSGEQGFSWVHLDDIAGIIEFLLEQEQCRGIYNGTAPNPVKQKKFSACLAKVLRKSHFMRVPAWVLKLVLGERSMMLLEGQLVLPERTLQAGYEYKYPEVEAALRACLLPSS